jgi:hypothetical protein
MRSGRDFSLRMAEEQPHCFDDRLAPLVDAIVEVCLRAREPDEYTVPFVGRVCDPRFLPVTSSGVSLARVERAPREARAPRNLTGPYGWLASAFSVSPWERPPRMQLAHSEERAAGP